jgi:hypothetical protein
MSYVYVPLLKAEQIQREEYTKGRPMNIFRSRGTRLGFYLIPCDLLAYVEGYPPLREYIERPVDISRSIIGG